MLWNIHCLKKKKLKSNGPQVSRFWNLIWSFFYQFINAEESVTLQPHSTFHFPFHNDRLQVLFHSWDFRFSQVNQSFWVLEYSRLLQKNKQWNFYLSTLFCLSIRKDNFSLQQAQIFFLFQNKFHFLSSSLYQVLSFFELAKSCSPFFFVRRCDQKL